MVYLWAQNSPVKTAAETLGVSRQCVQQHFLFLREVCSAHLINDPVALGGANVIVQIDESLFRHKPKYHRGRVPASDQWVFGLCDTSKTPGVGYMELVQDRRQQPSTTFVPIYHRYIGSKPPEDNNNNGSFQSHTQTKQFFSGLPTYLWKSLLSLN